MASWGEFAAEAPALAAYGVERFGLADSDGSGGEFALRGRATLVEDATGRALAAASASYTPADRYVVFALGVDGALSTVYAQGQPVRRRWASP